MPSSRDPERHPAWCTRRNPLKEAMQRGAPAVAMWVTSPWSAVPEILGASGADGVLLDLEHVSHGLAEAERLIVAADAAGVSALVRPPAIEPTLVSRILDAGAHGIVFPHVDDAAMAKRAVDCTRFGPRGLRGWGGAHIRYAKWQGGYVREHFDGQRPDRSVYNRDYLERAERETLTVVLIETVRGVENAPAIVATEGVDAVIFGWGDYAVEVGFDQDLCREAARKVHAECRQRGVGVGLSPFDDFYPGCFMIAGVDSLIMSDALAGAIGVARAAIERQVSPEGPPVDDSH